MVNGQAPPGIKTLEELGQWRCQGCGAWNGTQSDAAKVVQEMTEKKPETSPVTPVKHEFEESDVDEDGDAEHGSQLAEEIEGTSGADHASNTNKVTKRVTRSAGKPVLGGI